MLSIEELDTALSSMRDTTDDRTLELVIDALLLSESGPLKEQFLTGELEGRVPLDISEAVPVIAQRAGELMRQSGRDERAPQDIALTVGLFCYGAVLCSECWSEREFAELFYRSQSNFL